MPGIYEIRNKINGKRYIGSTTREFKKRWKEHKVELRGGRHHSPYLQHSWDFHGEENFEFTVLEEIIDWTYEKQILEREQWYFNAYKPEYNCVLTAEYTFPKKRKGKTYTVIKDGKTITFSNLAKFCRDNDLKECTLRAVIGGYVPDYKGYTIKHSKPRKSNIGLTLISPTGDIIKPENLEKFCLEQFGDKRKSSHFYKMRNHPHRWKSYKGWKIYNVNST